MKLYELTGMYLQLMNMMDDPDIDPDLIRDSMESLDGEIEDKADNIGMLIRGRGGVPPARTRRSSVFRRKRSPGSAILPTSRTT